MKYIHKYLFIFLLIFCITANAEDRSSYEGTHFYLGFMQNEIEIIGRGIVLQLFITSSYTAEFTVKVPGRPDQKYKINPKQVFHLDLPSNVENRQSEVNLPIAVEIISDVPISVYAFNSQTTTSDSYAAIPVNYWGNEYVIMSMPNDQYKAQLDPNDLDSSLVIPRSSEFMVIAAFDNTTIEFQPKAITRAGKQTFIKYYQTLNKGDCYLVQSYPFTKGYGDLTGTIVRSNKPIGVLSGHVRTAIPQNEPPYNNKDHLCEMLMPTSSWGKEFISVPFGTNIDGDLFKLTAIYDNTFITYRNPYGEHTIVLDAPGVSASIWDAFEPTVWRSNKPVQIGQFMRHRFGYDPDKSYDPCFVILPPVEQFVNRIIFQTLGNTPNNPFQFDEHYIYIICEQSGISGLYLDGVLVKNSNPMIQVQSVPGTQYNWEIMELTDGVHEIYCLNGKFSGVMYGIGMADSYGMTLGSSLNNPYKNDSIPPSVTAIENCGRISGQVNEVIDSINSGISFLYVDKDLTFNYDWQIEPYTDTSTTINFTAQPQDPTSNGQFVLDIYDKNNNKKEYRFFYFGLDIELPNNLDFGVVNINDSACITFPIKNNTDDTVRIDSINLTNENRLSIKPYFSFPYYLAPGDSAFCDVCFKPDSNLSQVLARLSIAFECDRIKYIPVYGVTESPNLQAVGFDFGKVRIGDTVCADVYIINMGNLPVTLDSLVSVQYSQVFRFDTLSIFPNTIDVGDSLKISVCFTPDSLMDYLTQQSGANSRSIPNSLIVTGSGAVPQVKSIIVDWGGRRIQTKNDTSFYLINTGSYRCNLKYEKFSDTNIAFDSTSFIEINNNLEPGDTIIINNSFYPFDTIQYQAEVQLNVDWKYHEPIIVELKGNGTVPQISTIDVVFDTTRIFTTCDTVAAVIKSFGNETLTIDSGKYYSGDSDSFVINYNLFRNLTLNPNSGDSLFSIPIQFKPKRVGQHEMIIELTHDAAPSYQRSTAYFKISGYGLREDTLKPEISADLSGTFYPCIKDTIDVILSNKGNVDLTLQSLTIQADNIEADFLNPITVPLTIAVDSMLKFPVYIIPERNRTGRIKISSLFNDSITIEKEFFINPEKNFITIQDIDNLEKIPDDIIELEIKGNIQKPTEIPVDFEVQLSTKQKNLFLIRENFDILFFNTKGVSKYKINLVQDSDKIVIRSEEKIMIDEPCNWSVKLKLLVLLGDDKDYEVKVLAMAEPCYEPDTTSFRVSLNDVCVFELRQVTLGETSLADVRILPNPVSDDINLIFTLGNDDWINFTVFDKLGKKCFESENLFLKKGIHSRIFEFSLITNGIYFLKVKNSVMEKNIMFIKYCY